MALIDEKPAGLPGTPNDLDNIPDDILGGPPEPAEIRLAGKTLTTLENPPGPGEDVVLMVRVKVTGDGTDYHETDDEMVHYRKTKLISCWKPGQAEPVPVKTKAELDAEAEAEAAKNQPPLYGDDGEPVDGEEFGRPPFSDSEE